VPWLRKTVTGAEAEIEWLRQRIAKITSAFRG
jgi:hypothetical protein